MKNDLRKMKSKTSTDTTSLLKVSDSTRLELVRLDSRGKLRTGRYQLFFGLGILKITFLMSTARWTWDLMVGSLLAGSSDVVETDSGGGRPGGMIQMGVWKLWEFASGRLLGGLLTAELLDEEVEIMIRLMGWIGFKLTGIVLLLMSMYNFYTSFSLYEEYKRGMAQIQLRQRDRETKGKDLHPFQSVLQQDTTLTYAERMKKNRIYVPVLKDPVENMGQDVRMKDERQGVLHSTPQLSDSNDRFNFNGLSTPLASMSTWNAGSFSLPGIDNLKLSSTMRNMGSPTAGYSTPQAQAHLPATLGSGMFSPSRLDQTNSMTPTRVSSGLSGLKPTADIGLPGIGSSSGVMAPIPFSGLQMNHPPYHTNTGSAGMLTNSFFTPTHSQDASNTGYPHGLHYDDEEAYHLLGKLKITWMTDSRIGSISTKEKPPPTVDDYIDDWTEEFRQYMRSYIINEVLLKFEKNCNDILNLLLDENFTKLFNPVRNKNEEARLTRILSFESDEEEDDKEMERLLQQCQILVLSATNNQLRSQLEERYSTLKRLLFERKRFERYFRLVRYVSNSHEIKGYVLRRLEALINSGKTMPQYRYQRRREMINCD